MSKQQLQPEVLWAQRSSATEASKNIIFLTIMASDISPDSLKLDLQPTSLTFSGYSNSKKVEYHFAMDFYAEIDPAESKTHHSSRDIALVLRKKELKEEYWPRLTKEKQKLHYLKTDFDKWVDEDEQDANPDEEDYMSKMNPAGGMPGGGMPGMGGDDFGGIDFSKLGGAGAGGAGGMDMAALQSMMAGAGGMGAGGMGGMPDMGGDVSDDDDDEDMPELEDEGHAVPKTETGGSAESIEVAGGATGASATRTSSGIEEVE
ncbi:hypothetical protein B0A49_12260 [Cryomyces minteri]|uniref:CS domain-containing protein n=1 Tax=Cryomyces minteri TaxID=331657 RepID=A0A4U0WCI3_9PEZI|nr:hypothetical protein B0A49_12260 [Cryomyces minteri]